MIKAFKYLLISTFITISFTSCSSTVYNKLDDVINPKEGTDFSKLSSKLSVNICSKLTSYKDRNEIYITDFVNISNLQNNSQLGFLLSSQLQVAILSNCDESIQVKELTLGQNIKIGKHGIKLLSRDISKIKAKSISQSGKAIIGTYAITSQKLIVYVKVVDLKNGDILYSQSSATNITDEILELEGVDNSPKVYAPMHL